MAGFPRDGRSCVVSEGLAAAFSAAGIEREEMCTNRRRTSTAKLRPTPAAQPRPAALTCCRADPNILLANWNNALAQLWISENRAAAEVAHRCAQLRGSGRRGPTLRRSRTCLVFHGCDGMLAMHSVGKRYCSKTWACRASVPSSTTSKRRLQRRRYAVEGTFVTAHNRCRLLHVVACGCMEFASHVHAEYRGYAR